MVQVKLDVVGGQRCGSGHTQCCGWSITGETHCEGLLLLWLTGVGWLLVWFMSDSVVEFKVRVTVVGCYCCGSLVHVWWLLLLWFL